MTQALRTGTQELMLSSQAAVVNTIKEWEIFDIPYLRRPSSYLPPHSCSQRLFIDAAQLRLDD